MKEYARKFPQGRWSCLEPGCEKKWDGTHTHKLDFAAGGHPVFHATSALEKGRIKKQRKRKEVYSLQRKEKMKEKMKERREDERK